MVYQHMNMPHIIGHEKKNGFSRFRPQTLNTWPCDMLIIIANVTWIGDWILLISKDISVGIMGILKMRTSSSLNFSLSIVRWITLIINFLSPKAFHCIVLVGLIFEASWPPSQSSAVNCVAASQAHPRSLKIQVDSLVGDFVFVTLSIDLNECRVPTIWVYKYESCIAEQSICWRFL